MRDLIRKIIKEVFKGIPLPDQEEVLIQVESNMESLSEYEKLRQLTVSEITLKVLKSELYGHIKAETNDCVLDSAQKNDTTKTLKDLPNIELEKLELKDGNILIIKSKKEAGATAEDLAHFAYRLKDSSALKNKEFHVISIDKDIDIKIIAAKEDDVLLVRTSDMSAEDKMNFVRSMKESPAYLNRQLPHIAFLDGDKDIKELDEKTLNEAGWYRLPTETPWT